MEPEKIKGLLIQQYGKNPTVKEIDLPKLNQGQVLVKVEGTTINPSDRYTLTGNYMKKPLPVIAGIEASGIVVKAEGEAVQKWVGKRVSFIAIVTGSWANYAVTKPFLMFEIDEDVSLQSASSGIVNPLTVIGLVEVFKSRKLKGIIHTAAASALGRMMNKFCIKNGIPLLNVVRRKEQEELLKSQGAEHVLITEGDWEAKYKEYVEKQGFDCLFDALGGGPTTKILIQTLPIKSGIFLYGALENLPLTIEKTGQILAGKKIEGFMLGNWWGQASEEVKNRVRENYSQNLKTDLSTKCYKELTFNEFEEALELSTKKTLQGKILMKPI